MLDDVSPVHSFHTLPRDLATIVRIACRSRCAPDIPETQLTNQASLAQRRAFALSDWIRV